MASAAREPVWPILDTEVTCRTVKALSLIGLGTCLFSLVLPPGARSESFGRWEQTLNNCQIRHQVVDQPRPEVSRDCLKLRLEQNIEGLLSARFVAAGEVVVFAGALAKGQLPMRCDSEGACKPQWPTQFDVQTVANGPLAASGLPAGLPKARLALGHCVIDRKRIACDALAADGEQWRAESQLWGDR